MSTITTTFTPSAISESSAFPISVEARTIIRCAYDVFTHFHQTETAVLTATKFERYVNTWKADTLPYSFFADIIAHPAYMSIISMGEDALPYIFESMRKEPGLWFAALEAITGSNPVMNESRGSIKLMTKDWLEWAEDNGYVS